MGRPPRLSAEAREHLRQAYAQIVELADRLSAAHPDQINCAHGCDDCCQQDLQVRGVEAAYLLECEAVTALDPAAAVPDACPLLRDGACVAYSHRPAICRTHGLVLRRREDGAKLRHTCEHNFSDLPLDSLARELILDEEHLTLLLDVIDALYCRETAWNGRRVSLVDLVRDALRRIRAS